MDPVPDEATNQQAAEILATIAADMERDAEHFDGQPFNGKTVAAYMGNQGAAIAAVAKILGAALLSDAPDPAPTPDRSGVVFLLWSNKHRMWWRPLARGYTGVIEEAGRYTAAEATRRVVQSAMCGTLQQVTCMVAAPDNWTTRGLVTTAPATAATGDGQAVL